MNNNITQKQFIRYLKYTPYFIWHELDELQKKEKLDEVENSFTWLRFDEEDLMIIDYDYKNAYSHKDLKATRIIQTATDKFLKEKFEDVYFIKAKNVDDAFEETKTIINGNKHKFIVNPVFKYEDAVARPKAFDVENKCLYYQKFSASTKKKDWCDVFWNFSIAKECIKIKDMQIILLSSGPNRKGEISFIISPTANTQTSSPSLKFTKIEDEGLSRYDNEVLRYKNQLKSGLAKSNNMDDKGKKRSVSTFKDIFILRNPSGNKKHIANDLMILKIDTILKDIREAKTLTKYTSTLKHEMTKIKHALLGHNDVKQILKLHNHPGSDISGSLISKSQLSDIILKETQTHKKDGILKNIFQKENSIDKKAVYEIISSIDNPKNRVIWYDFEGFSLPSATLDFFPPFQQTVFQVSIIETKNNVIQNTINRVYDPRRLSGDSFANIINNIYSLQAEVYVVYNKSYENTRIKEMIDWLLFTKHPLALQEKEKAMWIINRTVDLVDLFAARSRKMSPPILLHELQGMYSIKLLEKYIHTNNIKLPTEVHEYKKLEIQNGIMAMDAAIERSLGITGDKKWSEKVDALKIYCENDVRTMIVVYELAKHLTK